MAREWTVREHVAKEAFRKEKRQIPRLKVELDGSLIQMDSKAEYSQEMSVPTVSIC